MANTVKLTVVSKNPTKKNDTTDKNKYSDKELAEFQKLILAKLDRARKDHALLKETLCYTNSNDTNDTAPTFKVMEDGPDTEAKEEVAHLAARQEKLIRDLEAALVRIEHKTYGICRVTGQLIPKGRLMCVPHATLSIDAKLNQRYR